MQLIETPKLKFEQFNWARNRAFGLMDSIIESHPELLRIVESDIIEGLTQSEFGRKDIPSVV